MKLELKHLAPYLPYDLKIAIEVTILETDSFTLNLENISGVLLYQRKPILRPLEDISKEIIHNDKTIVPIVELLKTQYKSWDKEKQGTRYAEIEYAHTGTRHVACYKYHAPYRFAINNYQLAVKRNEIQYWVMEKLFEWHFDVFGLIEKGLALNKNEVKITEEH